eukprot:scaffold48_cov311-Pinguiococcus_pyrenoidosus.AAC.104
MWRSARSGIKCGQLGAETLGWRLRRRAGTIGPSLPPGVTMYRRISEKCKPSLLQLRAGLRGPTI